MARKRTKKLENGDSAHLYISQQVPAELLDYLNKQSDLSNFFMYAAVKLYEQTGNVDVANFMPRRFTLSDAHPSQFQPTPTTQYVVQQPMAIEPMMQQVQQPMVQEQTVEQPIQQQPIVQEPMVQQQVQQPIVQEPMVQQQVQQPIVQEPIAQQQVQQPIVQEPIAQQQVQQPIVQEQMPQQQVQQHPLSSPLDAEVTESDEDNSDDQWEGLNGFSADQLKNMNF